jgi:hypothetical protein
MNKPFIITIRDNVVDTADCSTEKTCEQDFLAKIKGMDPEGYKELDGDDIDNVVSDGYYSIDNASVCLTWIDVPGLYKEQKVEVGLLDSEYHKQGLTPGKYYRLNSKSIFLVAGVKMVSVVNDNGEQVLVAKDNFVRFENITESEFQKLTGLTNPK